LRNWHKRKYQLTLTVVSEVVIAYIQFNFATSAADRQGNDNEKKYAQ